MSLGKVLQPGLPEVRQNQAQKKMRPTDEPLEVKISSARQLRTSGEKLRRKKRSGRIEEPRKYLLHEQWPAMPQQHKVAD